MRISSIIPCVRNANGSGHEQRRQTDGPGKDEVNRMNDFRKTAQEMLEFIRISPTCFHAVANIGRMLEAAGFQQLQEKEEWKLEKGGRYYTERNDSSVIAFVIPEKEVGIRGFHMAAAHSDSPCFKIKEKPELTVEEHYLRLNTEKYGGMILSTWLDRPLSVAGRLAVKNGNGIEGRLVNIDRDLCVIPNVAIHMNREMNQGVAYNPQCDMLPLFADCSEGKKKNAFMKRIAKAAGVKVEDILSHDLFLYPREKGRVLGENGEFLLSPRLDDLQCVFAESRAFCESRPEEYVNVCAVFDNEEVGSGTKQGADSTFLEDTLYRIAEGLGLIATEIYGEEIEPNSVSGKKMLEEINSPQDLKKLNPDVDIKLDKKCTSIDISKPINELNLPENFYLDENNRITNKENTVLSVFVSLKVNEIKKNNKNVERKKDMTKEEKFNE